LTLLSLKARDSLDENTSLSSQVVNPPMENFWRVIHIRVGGIFEGGLKNAIAFMKGVVDPNIKY